MARLACSLAVTSIIILSSGLAAAAQEHEKTNFGLGFELRFFGVNSSIGDNIKAIENVPLELRQVPSHPDDIWIYGIKRVIRTIPYDSIDLGGFDGLTVSLSPELTAWRFRLRSGPNLYLGSFGGGPRRSNEGNTREINQYGKPTRGYGTSLVYYSIYGQSSWKPGITSEVDLDIGKGLLLMAGYGWNNHKLTAESGYDRWDALEKYESRKLADSRIVKRYLGFGWQPDMDNNGWRPMTLSLSIGKTRTKLNLTEIGKEMIFRHSNPWFFELSFSAHRYFWKK